MKTFRFNSSRFPAFLLALASTAATLCAAERDTQIAPGPFQPSWESLQAGYQCPEWFRDAKFGIWAHWSPQCQPEQGDWYARSMYQEGSADYKYHLQTYGHPSKVGFKEVCNLWKAENFEPGKLVALYKRAGAKYFVMLANHHCNFDTFDSTYQPWNAVKIGPKKDLVALWEKAARKEGLRFGVTVHSGRSWSWYEVAQGADKNGQFAGVAYDGKLTKADGKGQWWDGLDPQDLYAQNHTIGAKPDQAYLDKFFLRTRELIDKYSPDLLYFDDSVMPLGNADNVGLRLAAHLYNSNAKRHAGRNEAVLNTKQLKGDQRKALVWDIERGTSDQLEPFPWQTDTCIGSWHYQRALFDNHRYKTPATVIRMLVDIVSKNGNLLLSVPLRGDGTIDSDEVKILEALAGWMDVNGEGIFGTRPWKVFGEGAAESGGAANFNEGKRRPYTAQDIRFTSKGDQLYAFCLALPSGDVKITSLGKNSKHASQPVASVQLLGSDDELDWKQEADALTIRRPARLPCEHAIAFRIGFTKTTKRTPDVVFVPTPQQVVDKMLELAEVKPTDVVYDLGCGDARFLVTAAKRYGVKCYGFDINPVRVKESLENVRTNRVEHLVTIRQQDIFTLDLSPANVVTLYLLPDLNVKLMPQLSKLRPGSRIVSHDFDMRGAKPVRIENVSGSDQDSEEDTGEHTIYKWTVPWEPDDSR